MYVPSHSQSRALRPVLAVFAALLLTFSFGAATASAVPGPNQTQLSLDPALSLAAKVANIKIVPKGAATSGSAGLYFPVTNSYGVTDAFVGKTKHQGGFELQIGKNIKFGFRNLVVETKAGSPVTGVVTAEPTLYGQGLGLRIPLSKIVLTSVELRPPGVIAKYKLVIDENIMGFINKMLGISIIKPGQAWATLETRIARTAATPTPAPATTPVVSAGV